MVINCQSLCGDSTLHDDHHHVVTQAARAAPKVPELLHFAREAGAAACAAAGASFEEGGFGAAWRVCSKMIAAFSMNDESTIYLFICTERERERARERERDIYILIET